MNLIKSIPQVYPIETAKRIIREIGTDPDGWTFTLEPVSFTEAKIIVADEFGEFVAFWGIPTKDSRSA